MCWKEGSRTFEHGLYIVRVNPAEAGSEGEKNSLYNRECSLSPQSYLTRNSVVHVSERLIF